MKTEIKFILIYNYLIDGVPITIKLQSFFATTNNLLLYLSPLFSGNDRDSRARASHHLYVAALGGALPVSAAKLCNISSLLYCFDQNSHWAQYSTDIVRWCAKVTSLCWGQQVLVLDTGHLNVRYTLARLLSLFAHKS